MNIQTNLFDFAFVPAWLEQLDELADMTLPEPWSFVSPSKRTKLSIFLFLSKISPFKVDLLFSVIFGFKDSLRAHTGLLEEALNDPHK